MRVKQVVCLVVVCGLAARASGQTPQPPAGDHAGHDMAGPSPWMVMYDGALFATYNRQGGPRGVEEFVATNWLMGMASRRAGRGELTVSGMISLDPATAGATGYGELFQVGEAYRGAPLVDRQHPHDFVMQAALWWRVPLAGATSLTIGGAPVGAPALGPVAFMHRPSAAENSVAPLNHHRLDSTHVAMGVITAALDRGPWMVESSIFRGAEPDDQRWDVMDPGPLDSWSARLWFRPSARWELQVSHGRLNEPEELAPGDVRRTTASAAWFRPHDRGFTAATVAAGRNDEDHGASSGVLAEATHKRGLYSVYGRLETLQLDVVLLQSGATTGPDDDEHQHVAIVSAATIGAVRDLPRWRGFETGIGADLTGYRVPIAFQSTHGSRPLSFHVFFRLRPPAGSMGRMWNMRMGKSGH
jgi:hypothetical protein